MKSVKDGECLILEVGVISMNDSFDKAWGVVKEDDGPVKPYHGSMEDIDFCDMCVGDFSGGPHYERTSSGAIICQLCAEGLLGDKPGRVIG